MPLQPKSINTPIPMDDSFQIQDHVSENAFSSHFEAAKRRTSIGRFYNDNGPREDWDGPLSKHVKVSGLRNRRRDQNGDSGHFLREIEGEIKVGLFVCEGRRLASLKYFV